MVFQRDSVFPWMRVIDNVEYGLKCRGVAAGARREIARDYLQARRPFACRAGLAARAFRRHAEAGRHRGGIRQWRRGADARRAVRRARLCDASAVAGVLLDLWEEPGRAVPTVLFVTHDVDEALLLADRIVAMRGGAIVDDIPVERCASARHGQLLLPDMVAIKHKLLGHLGLEHGRSAARRSGGVTAASRQAGMARLALGLRWPW